MSAQRFFRRLAILLVLILAITVGALGALRIGAALRETATADGLAPKSGRFVATAAGRIYVQEAGPPAGMPVLLFHGTAGWSVLWSATQKALAEAGFRSIAFDIPPFGFSDKPADGAYDRTAQAARVAALLDALKVDRAVFVGHSYGAGPAVEAVMRTPGRAVGLVLLDAALGLSAGTDDAPAPLRIAFLREVIIAATATNPLAMRWLLSTMLVKKQAATPQIAATLSLPMLISGTTPAIGRWAESFMGYDREALSSKPENYARLALPVEVVWGGADTVTPWDQANVLAALIPGARLEIIPGLGHIPHLEDPALAIPTIVKAVRNVAGK